MNNFSDITAIETHGALAVQYNLIQHGETHSTNLINGQSIGYGTGRILVDLFDAVVLEITLHDFLEGSSGIEVELAINGLEVLPKYQHLATRPTNYIDCLGLWRMEIATPFYIWYHEITGQGWIA
jgi:hypothetical protein